MYDRNKTILNKYSKWFDIVFIIVMFAVSIYLIEATLSIIDKEVCMSVSKERFNELGCSKVIK